MAWNEKLKAGRQTCSMTQAELAAVFGVTERTLRDWESGGIVPDQAKQKWVMDALARLDGTEPSLTLLLDYVRIRFPTMNVRHVIEDVLWLKMKYMVQEDHAFYSYTSMYVLGDIAVMTSPMEEKGVLLELKGKGCRQFEAYLKGQHRSWYEFFRECLKEKAVFKRIDLAVNDLVGLLDIPCLSEKCENEECVSVFRSFKAYRSGELVRAREPDKASMGATLYIGSMKSDLYFCIYEKDYEQLVKAGIPIEDAEIKNRFEIRLKNDRAYFAVYDLVSCENPEQTAFGIINRYIRFVDRDDSRPREDWPLNSMWAAFIGTHRERLKLTAKPEPYTLQKTLNWLSHQVAPSWKMLLELDRKAGTDILEEMLAATKLGDKHRKIIEQQLQEIRNAVDVQE